MSAHGPSRHLVRCSDMSGVEVKADSKSTPSFGCDLPTRSFMSSALDTLF